VHGLYYFFIKKFVETSAASANEDAARALKSLLKGSAAYLPDGSCPDDEAYGLLDAVSRVLGEPIERVHARFGEYVAPHLIRVAGTLVDPSWRTLDVVQHADDMIRTFVHGHQESDDVRTHETVRISPNELHVVYYSPRKLCGIAAGIIHGVAAYFGESIRILESCCMRRGEPYCSFVVRSLGTAKDLPLDLANETLVVPRVSGAGGWYPGPAPTADSDPVPATIGAYKVLGLIGSGSMGRVYLARDEQLGRAVAIKVMRRPASDDPQARQRFLREGRSAAAISHPNVLAIYGVGEHEGSPYLVMQHFKGKPLSAYPRPFALLEALRIGREIASGLVAAHAEGLVHRDIKPQNIVLEGPDKVVKIIDFGLARAAEQSSSIVTASGVLVGTPAYMSPERLEDGPLHASSDLFGLGVLLYELLSGQLPYVGDSALSMMASIARGTPKPLSDVAPETPAEVCDFVMRLMAHRAEDRPKDAKAVESMITALEGRFSMQQA
jgi:predicted hydrocarbon binding protein/tRNA A-37 threonylcarbamoyl transferase component Bud32